MKIYLVINDKLISQTLKEFLTKINFEVSIIYPISELLNVLHNKQDLKSVVIIEEDSIRGEERVSIKKIHEQYPDILIIVLTTVAPEFSTEEAIEYGIYGYLHKPISLAELELFLVRIRENLD